MTVVQHQDFARHILTELRGDSIHKLHHLFLNMFLCEQHGDYPATLVYAEMAVLLEMMMEWPPEITSLIADDAEIEAHKIGDAEKEVDARRKA